MDKRDKNGRFAPGNAGGPGRPKGYRAAFVEDFVRTLQADFEKHGAEAMERVRQENPSAYLQVASKLIPKEIDHTHDVDGVVDHTHKIEIELVKPNVL